MITNYEKLKPEYHKNGMRYELVSRNDKAAMYKQYSLDNVFTGYEVFQVKIQPEYTFPNGLINPAKESFPSDESFGKNAWCYMVKEKDKAEEMYQNLTNNINNDNIVRKRGRPKTITN